MTLPAPLSGLPPHPPRLGAPAAKAFEAALIAIGLASSCGAPVERPGIVFDERFGRATSLDLFLPEGGDPGPAVLLIHPGANVSGSKEGMNGTAQRLARAGYVVASMNYRLVPGGEFPKDFQDSACALAFLRRRAAEYRLDPGRIVAMGYSSGGRLASLLGVASDHPELAPDCEAAAGQPVARPAAVVNGSGPNDMRALRASSTAVDLYMGGGPDQLPHLYDLASAIFHVAPNAPPYLLISDDLFAAEIEANARMRDALRAAGNQAQLLHISGGWHVMVEHSAPGLVDLGMTSETPEAWIALEDFLERTVGRP